MDWRAGLALAEVWYRQVLTDDGTSRLAAALGAGLLVVLTFAVSWMVKRRRHRRSLAGLGSAGGRTAARGVMGLGDWGRVDLGREAAATDDAGVNDPSGEVRSDRALWQSFFGSLGLALAAGACVWLAGLSMAPGRSQFLMSREWQFQPFYLAGHIVAVRMFALAYARGFLRGLSNLVVPDDVRLANLARRIIGWPSILAAVVIAAPFAASDYFYMLSDAYERLGGVGPVLPVNYLMWGLWSVEWVLNAYIWVVLLAFLVKNSRAIKQYRFRAPIEIVLHDRHYKPFLQMSAHGATILLAFTLLSVAYIWYTGGGITDYIGLMITSGLLLFGFIPPWVLLKAKVRRAVEGETFAMRRRLLTNLDLAEKEEQSAALHRSEHQTMRSLEHRLDAAVSILRISYLENRFQQIGRSEARDILIKMMAPAGTIMWQAAKSYPAVLEEAKAYLMRLF